MKHETFENAMDRLEQIVQELEQGELPLESAFEKFEEGIKLSKLCTKKLDETEKKVMILMKDSNGELQEAPFLTNDIPETRNDKK